MADLDDDRLLDALGVALRPTPSEPSAAELTALRAVVADVAKGARSSRSSRLRRWVAGLVVGGVVLSGGTAYATSPVAPRPVRSAAFALKLPVEAPDLTDAKDALDDLEEELREGRRDKVADALEEAEEELADLSASSRQALDPPRASTLLATAAAFLADPRTLDGPGDDDDSEDDLDDSSGRGPSGHDGDAGDEDRSGPNSGRG